MLSMETYMQTNADFHIPFMLSMKTYMQTNVDFPIPGMLRMKTYIRTIMLIFPFQGYYYENLHPN